MSLLGASVGTFLIYCLRLNLPHIHPVTCLIFDTFTLNTCNNFFTSRAVKVDMMHLRYNNPEHCYVGDTPNCHVQKRLPLWKSRLKSDMRVRIIFPNNVARGCVSILHLGTGSPRIIGDKGLSCTLPPLRVQCKKVVNKVKV